MLVEGSKPLAAGDSRSSRSLRGALRVPFMPITLNRRPHCMAAWPAQESTWGVARVTLAATFSVWAQSCQATGHTGDLVNRGRGGTGTPTRVLCGGLVLSAAWQCPCCTQGPPWGPWPGELSGVWWDPLPWLGPHLLPLELPSLPLLKALGHCPAVLPAVGPCVCGTWSWAGGQWGSGQ